MRRRFKRQVYRKGFRLTARDMAIVEAVWEARYMTISQIAALLFRATTYASCKRRVRGLFDLDYLRKRRTYRNEPDILYLGLLGKRYIQKVRGMGKERVEKAAGTGTKAANPILFMRHDLTLTDLYVQARLNCNNKGLTLTWKNTRVLQLAKLGVRPDAWLMVSRGNKSQAAFVEFTDQMPKAREMERKRTGYEALFADRGPTRVLWFATTLAKAVRLHEKLAPTYFGHYFYISLLEKARDFLTDPVWWVADNRQSLRFLQV